MHVLPSTVSAFSFFFLFLITLSYGLNVDWGPVSFDYTSSGFGDFWVNYGFSWVGKVSVLTSWEDGGIGKRAGLETAGTNCELIVSDSNCIYFPTAFGGSKGWSESLIALSLSY